MTEQAHTTAADSTGMLQVLLTEQKHINTQIETTLDLQIKILAFLFPALAAASGWILYTTPRKEALLVLIVVMCFGILFSVICYNLSAEYSRYKSEVLGARIQRLLGSPNPLDASRWGRSDIGQTLVFALVGLWTTILATICIVLAVATRSLWGTSSFTITVRISLCLSYVIALLSLFSVVMSLSRGTSRVFRGFVGVKSSLHNKQ